MGHGILELKVVMLQSLIPTMSGFTIDLRSIGYPRKVEQVGRDSRARSAPLSRLKLVPDRSSPSPAISFKNCVWLILT